MNLINFIKSGLAIIPRIIPNTMSVIEEIIIRNKSLP